MADWLKIYDRAESRHIERLQKQVAQHKRQEGAAIMKVYEVVMKYFDNGSVRVAFHTYELDHLPENRMEESPRCDVYHDYFTDKRAACQHYADAKRA